MLLVSVYLILSFLLIVVSFSPSVFLFCCVLYPMPLPLSSCLGCIPPLIGLPSLRFLCGCLSVVSTACVFLFVFSILSRRCPLLATSLSVLFCLLSLLTSNSRFDLVWFRLSCDHGWIRSGSVHVRKTTTLVYCIISLIVMQGYFTKKNRTNLDLLSIPSCRGGGDTEYRGSLGYNSVFRVCYITSIDVDVILDACSTIEIVICYHK